jgi:hypothetical protein
VTPSIVAATTPNFASVFTGDTNPFNLLCESDAPLEL